MQYQKINALLNARLAERTPLIAVHRGTGLGNVPENTLQAVKAALRQGADMVEIDIIKSTDGDFFLFHDGCERQAFDRDIDIRELSTEEIRTLRYRWIRHEATVTGLDTLLERLGSGVLLNVDRSWWYWDDLLPFADRFNMTGQLVFKSPVEEEWLERLRRHPVKYPYIPMVRSRRDIEAVLGDPDINLVGVELIAAHKDDELARPDVVTEMHASGLACLLNAINLPDGVPLFAGHDDRTSVFDDPADGWGWLMKQGADIIQTDWPDLLLQYRDQVRGVALPPQGFRHNPAVDLPSVG
ncbi:glycerophosphodiester phosphodiesterase family protein [Micromonospora sp. NPDC050276]|uniref:glycerophosphodiester phosphodiesterase family protein n=1 Tax=Micromonospora sp. NPDC050276 TaxID=3364278 RepID=UPI0037A2C723